jgi:hypothetical protein
MAPVEPRAFPDPFTTLPPLVHEPEAVADPDVEIDHGRLLALVDGLERDVALIESAMTHIEAREFSSANAALDVLDDVVSA